MKRILILAVFALVACGPDWTQKCVCAGLPCGSGNSCGGTCQEGSGCIPPSCTPTCANKVCGFENDGCGHNCLWGSGCSCDEITDPATRLALGCTPACEPNCVEVACGGSDGCGGYCNGPNNCPVCERTCVAGVTHCGADDGCDGKCLPADQCAPVCTPECKGKKCGQPDGCDGVCPVNSGCDPGCEGDDCGGDDECIDSCSGVVCGQKNDCRNKCHYGSGCYCPEGQGANSRGHCEECKEPLKISKDNICYKECKDKAGCTWLSREASCNDRPPSCDAKPNGGN